MSYDISIIGASGYTGGELLRILHSHPKVKITGVYGKTTTGQKVSELHPNLQELLDLTIKEPNYEKIGKESDLVFTATPHGTPMNFVPNLLDKGTKVIDLSADYRIDDVQTYEKHYTEHESPELESVYGLPETNREKIKEAELIANPGCYPTAAILSITPLLKENKIELDPIILDSKSGTSGAGAKPSEKLHYPTCSDNIRAYNATSHRHAPEIRQEIGKIAGKKVNTHFTPHLIPTIRGILNTTHAFLHEKMEEEKLISLYREYYKEEPFIRVLEKQPQTNAVRGSNYCDITVRTSKTDNRITAISTIDNLIKGASGQAVQNMNLVLGLKEGKGLENLPLRP